jgi:hypothetical protein
MGSPCSRRLHERRRPIPSGVLNQARLYKHHAVHLFKLRELQMARGLYKHHAVRLLKLVDTGVIDLHHATLGRYQNQKHLVRLDSLFRFFFGCCSDGARTLAAAPADSQARARRVGRSGAAAAGGAGRRRPAGGGCAGGLAGSSARSAPAAPLRRCAVAPLKRCAAAAPQLCRCAVSRASRRRRSGRIIQAARATRRLGVVVGRTRNVQG